MGGRGYDFAVTASGGEFYVNFKAEVATGRMLETLWLMSYSVYKKLSNMLDRLYVLHLEYLLEESRVRARRVSWAGPVSSLEVVVYDENSASGFILRPDGGSPCGRE